MENSNPALYKQLANAYFADVPNNPFAGKSNSIPMIAVSGVRASWTLDDWLDKDPKGLEAMENSNPALYKQLANAYFADVPNNPFSK